MLYFRKKRVPRSHKWVSAGNIGGHYILYETKPLLGIQLYNICMILAIILGGGLPSKLPDIRQCAFSNTSNKIHISLTSARN